MIKELRTEVDQLKKATRIDQPADNLQPESLKQAEDTVLENKRYTALELIVATIATGSDEDVTDTIRQIRAGTTLQEISDSINKRHKTVSRLARVSRAAEDHGMRRQFFRRSDTGPYQQSQGNFLGVAIPQRIRTPDNVIEAFSVQNLLYKDNSSIKQLVTGHGIVTRQLWLNGATIGVSENSEMFRKTVGILSLAFSNDVEKASTWIKKGLQSYSKVLRDLQKALEDPIKAHSIEVLCTIILLGVFEVF